MNQLSASQKPANQKPARQDQRPANQTAPRSAALHATFLVSAARLDQCPDDDVPEIAFVGRSNAGKSSVLNCLSAHKQLARVSRTPGRTQLLNFFSIAEGGRFVDLPGYGYASAPLATRQRWQKELERYLTRRPNLQGLVLVTDIRHPLKDTDLHMIDWARSALLPTLALANKCDKLRSGARQAALLEKRRELEAATNVDSDAQLSVLAFSAQDGTGLPDALRWIRARLACERPLPASDDLPD